MNDPQVYVKCLRKLYDERKIGVSENSPPFDCCHLECCKAVVREDRDRCMRMGAESHIGEKYGDPIRLVVISLDTGGSYEERKMGEDLPERREIIQGVTFCNANPHMKGTIRTLQRLYGREPQELEGDLLQRFAMINSAKCSAGKYNKDASRVPDKLYENCKEHGLAEMAVLDPQLVVAQGSMARDLLPLQDISEEEIRNHVPSLVWGDADVGSWICTQVKEHLKYWKNGDQPVLVLQAPHPSARQGQWKRFERTMLPTVAHVVRQWLPVPRVSLSRRKGRHLN